MELIAWETEWVVVVVCFLLFYFRLGRIADAVENQRLLFSKILEAIEKKINQEKKRKGRE